MLRYILIFNAFYEFVKEQEEGKIVLSFEMYRAWNIVNFITFQRKHMHYILKFISLLLIAQLFISILYIALKRPNTIFAL